ncbi:AraC family transcriptional regulator [Leeia oryzae]|uniref:AraC family transcriptional regulator n=1 Tax=Leeia oryzae TaxID=356662 RepID=UPI00036DF633|nr:nuclear transport factor 2 family protein [Leeia oryzae]
MSVNQLPVDAALTEATRAVALQSHLAWKQRDLEAIMALYHPDIEYFNFFQNRVMHLQDLRAYVSSCLPRGPQESLEHTDRIRADGDTAFIQYQITIRSAKGLFSYHSSESIVVRDGKIWRVKEYATLVSDLQSSRPHSDLRPALQRLGLSARQLGFMAQTLQDYVNRQQPFLQPDLNLQQVADATGFTRNQISYLLNQVFGQTFYRFMNQARLQYLLRMLAEQPGQPVDTLAFQAGFNSLSVFYSCFRAHTGQSPKAYLKSLSERTRTEDKPATPA